MALILEDGTGVTSANTYASVAELEAYALPRLDISTYTNTQKENALTIASQDWIDGEHQYLSEPLLTTQGLKFPTIDNEFPAEIKKAALIAAFFQLQGLLFINYAALDLGGEIISESDNLGGKLQSSVTYAKGTSQRKQRILPNELHSLVGKYTGSGMSRRL